MGENRSRATRTLIAAFPPKETEVSFPALRAVLRLLFEVTVENAPARGAGVRAGCTAGVT